MKHPTPQPLPDWERPHVLDRIRDLKRQLFKLASLPGHGEPMFLRVENGEVTCWGPLLELLELEGRLLGLSWDQVLILIVEAHLVALERRAK